jgi:TetR/AcrR family transcriptional repressor of nem operon
VFRQSLERENRLCLGSFMSAEYDDLPAPVTKEVQTFSDVNVAWLERRLVDAGIVGPADGEDRARAIFAAVAGAQLMARSRSDIALFDTLIGSYRSWPPAGLTPAAEIGGTAAIARSVPIGAGPATAKPDHSRHL